MLKVGTDCSGIEAPVQALIKLGIPFNHIFSCDNNLNCIKSIKANYKPGIIFNDITTRNLHDIPDIDLYVCGFPCQPFSSVGNRHGFNDKLKGNIFFNCINVIKHKQPIYFILENVKGILSNDKGNTFNVICEELKKLSTNHNYYIHLKLLNTKNYGIPQSRDRLYIVGTKHNNFVWPEKLQVNPLSDYIDYNDTVEYKLTQKMKLYIDKVKHEHPNNIFVDLAFQNYNTYKNADKICPCIITCGMLWNIPMKRKANINELLKLQGFPQDFKRVVSICELKKQIGNSMSVNVLEQIMIGLLKSPQT